MIYQVSIEGQPDTVADVEDSCMSFAAHKYAGDRCLHHCVKHPLRLTVLSDTDQYEALMTNVTMVSLVGRRPT